MVYYKMILVIMYQIIYLSIFYSRIFSVIWQWSNDWKYIGTTNSKIHLPIVLYITAGVVNTKNPAIERAQIRNFEIWVALFEASTTTNFAFRRQTGIAIGNSIPQDTTTVSRFESNICITGS